MSAGTILWLVGTVVLSLWRGEFRRSQPSEIRRRAWLGLARCIVGVPVVAACGVAVFLLLLPFTAAGG